MTAQAATLYGGDWTTSNVKIRKGPSTNTAIVGTGNFADGAVVKCKARGEGIYGNTIWWYVRNNQSSSNTWGYTSDYYFNVAGAASPPWC
ncbi:hypothetical protein ACFY9F_18885 [Streptomyces sp. NPDC012421]|uniref:hypothetical protein n=1 Tax=Streptomyces sp. NPDC012421 TaxID=3364832 RepID=UPI0036E0EBD4